MALHNVVQAHLCQATKCLHHILPVTPDDVGNWHHRIPGEEQSVLKNVDHNGVGGVPRGVDELQSSATQVQEHLALIKHDIRQAQLHVGKFRSLLLCLAQVLLSVTLQVTTCVLPGDNVCLRVQVVAVHVIGMIVSIDDVANASRRALA